MIVVHCACGEVYNAEDDKAGYSLICTKCRQVIDLEVPGRKPAYVFRTKRTPLVLIGASALVLAGIIGYTLSKMYDAPIRPVPEKSPLAETPSAKLSPAPRRAATRTVQASVSRQATPRYIPTSEDYSAAKRDMKLIVRGNQEERNTFSLQHSEPPPSDPISSGSSLATGTNIREPIDESGRSTLTVINGNRVDAVVKLVGGPGTALPNATYRCVYIKGGEQFVIGEIPAGRYFVLFKLGSGWNNQSGFVRGEENHRFGKPLVFEQTTSEAEDGGKK